MDPVLEITEITDRVVKAGGPALLFRHPRGSSMPVLTNQFGSDRRMALALRASSYDALAQKVRALTELEVPHGALDKLKALAKLKDLAALGPKTVKTAPCHEVSYTGDQVDLGRLPVLTCWPLDGGPFITLPVVFTRDPKGGRRNAGMYRLQVYDARTTGMHWHLHKDAAEHYRHAGGRQWRWRWPSAPTLPSPTPPPLRCPRSWTRCCSQASSGRGRGDGQVPHRGSGSPGPR